MNRSPGINDWTRMVSEIVATQIELDRIKELLIESSISIGIVAGGPVTLIAGAFALGSQALGAVGLATTQDSDVDMDLIAIRQGNLILTTAQWDAVTGDSGGLIPNTLYYVTDTGISKTRPVSGNVYQIGSAVNSTELKIG